MKLSQLTKAQYDAAMHAAAIVTDGNPNRAECRVEFREARLELEQLLVEPADARDLINQAIRWMMDDAIASACIPASEVERV